MTDPRPATDRQRSFISKLITEVYGPDSEYHGKVAGMALSTVRASEMIDNLLAKKREVIPAPGNDGPDLRGLRGGYYAAEEDNGKLRFLRIKVVRDDASQWNGWVFIEEQAGDEHHKVGSQRPTAPFYVGRYGDILTAIAADEVSAMARYGLEIGSCGACGRTLTNERSRELGIGPECADRLGIPY